MAATTYQQALTTWQKRAGQFAAAGVPQSVWSKLYYQDMAGVYQGRQPMTDADVYTGIVSAVNGPVIKDPTATIAHHSSILSTIGHVISNVPKDIGGIITGLEGIPHILMHLPSEIDNTGQLISHLASGDNSWLQQKGYIKQGESVHDSWSGFATMLRAMNTNGSKQLLPFIPFLSDLADMTNGEGRAYLQQHPVGAFLDVLPGIVKVGHLATDGMALEANAAERGDLLAEYTRNQGMSEKDARARVNQEIPADYSNIYRTSRPGSRDPTDPTKRFHAAGRALQTGNPVKALLSAAGDLIPFGRDEVGTKITARDYINIRAAAAGVDWSVRELINRPINNMSDELSATAKHLRDKVFGSTTFFARNKNSVERNHLMYMLTHGINPDTGEMFKSDHEANAMINSRLSEAERGDIANAAAFNARQQQEALAAGRAVQIPDPHYGGVNLFKTNSEVHRAYQKAVDAQAEVRIAEGSGNAKQLVKATERLQKAYGDFREVTWRVAPDAWQPAIGEMMRSKFNKEQQVRVAAGEMTEEDARNVEKDLATSPWETEYKRLMGDDAYTVYRDDAMMMWRNLQRSGYTPMWTHNFDPAAYDDIFNPKVGRVDKPTTPEAFSHSPRKDWGMFFGSTVQNVAVLLSRHELELVREQAVSKFLTDIVIPQFTVDATKTKRDFYEAITTAAQAGKLKIGPWDAAGHANKVIKQNFRQFDPTAFGIAAERAGLNPQQVAGRYITAEAENALKRVFNESLFSQTGLPVLRSGTRLYKFAVLTGPRHLVHVAAGSAMMMLGRQPLAITKLWESARYMKALRTGEMTAEQIPALAKLGLTGRTASGIRERPYNMTSLHQYWHGQVGSQLGQDVATSWIDEAKRKGVAAAEYVPQRLAALEEKIVDMYRTAVMLDKYRRNGDATAALEAAHKTFVDVNGMTNIERTVVKQVFPFYAFTRHLFRYLFTYPVDYPLRAAIISQFAEGEQKDWTSGLPRSYMSLFWLGHPNSNGDIHTFDMKNLNPFRSFASDFSVAGFLSSLSPFLTIPFQMSGVNLLSGTSQLYPGTVFNPQTGTLQATAPPGGLQMIAEQFVPQIGLLDHFLKLTNQTRALATFDKNAYNAQLFNMLNVPFVPEVINVPYEKEITEMRRFRQAQTAVTAVENMPSAQNINKLLQWNLVPWNNWLIPPDVLANYYRRIEDALRRAQVPITSPKVIQPQLPTHTVTLGSVAAEAQQ